MKLKMSLIIGILFAQSGVATAQILTAVSQEGRIVSEEVSFIEKIILGISKRITAASEVIVPSARELAARIRYIDPGIVRANANELGLVEKVTVMIQNNSTLSNERAMETISTLEGFGLKPLRVEKVGTSSVLNFEGDLTLEQMIDLAGRFNGNSHGAAEGLGLNIVGIKRPGTVSSIIYSPSSPNTTLASASTRYRLFFAHPLKTYSGARPVDEVNPSSAIREGLRRIPISTGKQ